MPPVSTAPPRWRAPAILAGKIVLVLAGVWLAVQAVSYLARFTAPILGLTVAVTALLVEPVQVWMATLLLPLLPGLVALTRWRARQPAIEPAAPTTAGSAPVTETP